ncbi:phenylacetaldehyde reductase-like [Salvia splendens]|uniref:phenylacetaldehyde reductase-like n=1 Tax=Salvia splendens TaxID=180675 RepID=UPI001C268498|nr:phenylacetaldehyde reductase-like [Salvia splendens]
MKFALLGFYGGVATLPEMKGDTQMSESTREEDAASGYIGSWLVKLLLHRGYTVKATVRNLSDPSKVEHLKALEGAEERLYLCEANLVKEGSFDSVIDGCDVVFHTASPVMLDNVNDPQVELIEPAVKGTLNVLGSCGKAQSVKIVVLTCSMVTIAFKKPTPKL